MKIRIRNWLLDPVNLRLSNKMGKKTYTDRSPMVTGQSTEEAKGWKSRKMKTSEGHRKAANLWFFLMMCWFMALLSQAARCGTNEISHHSLLTSFFLFGFHFWICNIFWRQFLVDYAMSHGAAGPGGDHPNLENISPLTFDEFSVWLGFIICSSL